MFSFLRIFKRIRKDKLVRSLFTLFLILFVLFILHCVLFVIFEQVSLIEAVWQTWQTITTVGYGNKPAETFSGRLTTMLVSTFGIAVLGGVFSLSMDMKQSYNRLKVLGLMTNKEKNGYVILNFPGEQTAIRLINEIRLVEEKVSICFVDESLDSLPEIIKDVVYIRGDLLEKETYVRANIQNCKSVLVFPTTYASNADATSKVLVDLVLNCYPDIRVIYLLVDQKNKWMFNDKATPILRNFWILALVQECQDPHTAFIMEHILSNLHNEDILTVEEHCMQHWKWGYLCSMLIEMNAKVKPLALIKKDSVDLFPDYHEKIGNNKMSFIVTKGFVWKNFKDELLQYLYSRRF